MHIRIFFTQLSYNIYNRQYKWLPLQSVFYIFSVIFFLLMDPSTEEFKKNN